jgi:hypothetical protein
MAQVSARYKYPVGQVVVRQSVAVGPQVAHSGAHTSPLVIQLVGIPVQFIHYTAHILQIGTALS